jgi:hypothetical protein
VRRAAAVDYGFVAPEVGYRLPTLDADLSHVVNEQPDFAVVTDTGDLLLHDVLLLNLSAGVSVDVLNLKAEGLDRCDVAGAERLGAGELGKTQRRGVGRVRVKLHDTVNTFDVYKNNWHIDLQNIKLLSAA